jgi:hypothetical protein
MEPKESKSDKHFYISIFKSAIRIMAGVYLFVGELQISASLFVIAELLGIAEEL